MFINKILQIQPLQSFYRLLQKHFGQISMSNNFNTEILCLKLHGCAQQPRFLAKSPCVQILHLFVLTNLTAKHVSWLKMMTNPVQVN